MYLYSKIILLIVLGACTAKEEKKLSHQQVATTWADMALYITKNTPANSPTFASRGFGYIGLTMYESVVHGYPDFNSLGNQLNGLMGLPLPDRNSTYDWILSLNAGQAAILKKIYNQTSDANKHKIDSLERVILTQFTSSLDKDVIQRSIDYGKAIADAIFEWSKTDGGHRAYLNNFDKSLIAPSFPGCWEPTLYGQSFSHFPLHPYWGKNRTFIVKNAELPAPGMIPFDTSRHSDYHKQFERVYEKSKTLTQQEKETALWWGDDPSETFAPAGHSYYIGTLVIKKLNPELPRCAETYASIGMATTDAFINCWKWKYHFWSERPSSYIPKHIDERWQSFWPDPPFPAFPSGHATQAGAAASVLIGLYGEEFSFTDSTHVGRMRDELRDVDFVPRSFTSFWQVAEETANSRFYGGIHSPQDNDVGLAEGRKIGENVNALNWRNKSYAATDR